jgi:methionyl-tRNA formyltransferase
MSDPLRLVFLGSDPIALPLLEWLTSGPGRSTAGLVAIVTQPDRAVGRGQKVAPKAIKRWGQARGLPVLQPESPTEDFRRQLADFAADVALVMAYGHLLREEFIMTPRLGTLNLHTSLLPRYRGASPIQTAIAQGETETGVTLMRIVRRLDAGPAADVERVAIAPGDTSLELAARLGAACVPLLARTLPRLADGTLVFSAQDESAATYCRKLQKEDGALDFTAPAQALASRINGLFPWPSCTVPCLGQVLRLGLADVAPLAGAPGLPGEIIGHDAGGLLVGTGAGVLRLRHLQRPAGRMLPAAEFLRGFPIPAGSVLPSRPMPELVSPRPFPRRPEPPVAP